MAKAVDINDILTIKYGKLTVIRYLETVYSGRNREHYYECDCDCGKKRHFLICLVLEEEILDLISIALQMMEQSLLLNVKANSTSDLQSGMEDSHISKS